MTIRKLTVAAAIAVGIATCSFNTVMAAARVINALLLLKVLVHVNRTCRK